MCGIAGIFALRDDAATPDRALLESMARTMVHRGPDDDGYFAAPGVGLAMRRLSIIDVAGGKQPLVSEDGRVRAIQNGEIYNYRELRQELEGRGHTFATASDTEVLVHGYEEFGVDFLDRLNGMFGVAVHDAGRNRLVVARDRLGIKPLYYAECDGVLLFASEMKALLAYPVLRREVDPTALDLYLALGYVPAPRSILRGVHKLPPGHRIVADRAGYRVERWWSVPSETLGETPSDATARVRELIADSVRMRCIADVPLGAFLSGGIDSSAIVGFMRETGQDPVRTFSIGFEDQSYDESEFARVSARRYGTEHIEEIAGPDAWKLTGRLARQLDEPFADTSLYPTFQVSEIARRHVTVVLSGDGGDELFGGYHAYRALDLESRYKRYPALLRAMFEKAVFSLRPTARKRGLINSAQRFLEGTRLPPALGHMRWMLHADATKRAGIRGAALRAADDAALANLVAGTCGRATSLDAAARAMFLDMQVWLPDDILVKVDRMSMAVSLEARTPFLDHRLVEYVARLPSSARIDGQRTKIVLRDAVRDLVPPEVLGKKKEGFSVPMKNWLRGELKEEAAAWLAPSQLGRHGFFDTAGVDALWREHQAGAANHAHVLFAILMFEQWYDATVEGK
ncbi:MAG: asparagine synthase (glutamine-hydrolyzing) [Planctomycetota bacterium]|jgi:asparagine synthase (glutamine-hydrolysing)